MQSLTKKWMERNPALKEKYGRFLVKALEICRKELFTGITLLTQVPPYYTFSPGTPVVSMNQFRQRVGMKVNALQSFNDCVVLLEKHPDTAGKVNITVASPHMSTTVSASSLVSEFLYDYLRIVPTALFYEKLFDSLYSRREDYLYSDSVAYLSLTPIFNFEGDFQSLELSPSLTIRKLSPDEREAIEENFGQFQMGAQLVHSDYVIAQVSIIPKNADISVSSMSAQKNYNEHLILQCALILFRPGFVGTRFTVELAREWTPIGGPAKIGFSYEMPFPGPKYKLIQTDTDNFREFYLEFLAFQKSEFAIPLRRFNFFYDRQGAEDRIIDSMVAFENLLLPERSELSLRLSVRAANLLGESSSEKHEIFNFFMKAYDVRSKIAHGESIPETVKIKQNETITLDDLSIRLQNYLRRAIVKLLRERQKNVSKDEIMRKLTNPFQD